jgi:hypothetical protein
MRLFYFETGVTTISNAYISVAEFTNAPTGIDVTKLIPNGTPQQNQAELANVIRRASSWIDSYCGQVLAATVDTETITTRLNRDGFLRIQPANVPIISVQSLSYKLYPQAEWNLIDPSTYQVFPDRIESYNFFSYFGLFWPNLPMPYMPQPMGQPYQPYTTPEQAAYIQNIPLMVRYTYVNGYPNTYLAANATAGEQTLTLVDVTGVQDGTKMTIYDGENTEDIVVSGAPNGNVVTLKSPLVFDHNANVAVSALPAAVKEACIIMTAYLIHNRGRSAIKASPTGPYRVSTGTEDNIDIEHAKEMLRPYRRIVVTQR